MKKINKLLLITLSASILALSACQKNTDPAQNPSGTEPLAATDGKLDIEGIFSELSGQITFKDTMQVVDDSYSEMLINIAPELYSDCILYMGGGATAEELLLFQAADETSAKSIAEKLNTHIEDQRLAFEGYDPEELRILEHAYITSNDSIVICCVCDDHNGARELIDQYVQ